MLNFTSNSRVIDKLENLDRYFDVLWFFKKVEFFSLSFEHLKCRRDDVFWMPAEHDDLWRVDVFEDFGAKFVRHGGFTTTLLAQVLVRVSDP